MLEGDSKESDRYAIAVIGAGPAGIAAAVTAAEAGQRVILIEECPAAGGQIWRGSTMATSNSVARGWFGRLEHSTVVLQTGTVVVDIRKLGDLNFQLTTAQNGTGSKVRASRLVLATGARELFLPYPGWTLPGAIGVGAAQALIKSGLSVRDKRVVVTGSGPLLLPVAAALQDAGAQLQLVAEQASQASVTRFALGLWRRPGILAQAVRYRARFRSVSYRTGTWIAAAEGSGRVERVVLTDGRKRQTIECDLLCASFGLIPNLELSRLAGCRLQNGFVAIDARQETSVEGIYAVGEPTGIGGVELALAEGALAGCAASGGGDAAEPWVARCHQHRRHTADLARAFELRPELGKLAVSETIVCRCEDVPLGALNPAWSMRQAKLYTRVGMGPCQGRVCGAALQHLYGWTPEIPHTPVEPVPVSALL